MSNSLIWAKTGAKTPPAKKNMLYMQNIKSIVFLEKNFIIISI